MMARTLMVAMTMVGDEGPEGGENKTTASTTRARGPNRLATYFVPGWGINKEVITTDICRYLGPDALVKPANDFT